MRHHARRAAVGVFSLFVLGAASACAGGDSAEGGAGDVPSGDRASWTLPVQAYLPDEKQKQLVFDAREALLVKCMARYGFSYKPAPPLPKFGPKSMTDLRYGIHDEATVSRYGYKPPVDLAAIREQERAAVDGTVLSADEEAVMTGQGAAGSVAADLPAGGCGGEVVREITGSDAGQSMLATELGNEAYIKAQQEPEVKQAFADWASCMKEKGFPYEKPMDAVDDQRFASEKPSEAELSTAGADLACRAKSRVAEVWYAAEVTIQKSLIEQNSERLDKVKSDLALSVKNASKVLGDKG
ncbi:hypothetical protein ABTX80_22940 [Streptomyces erythrochromogenes]|uniref:hypothetical protein n=1 Tax=Streptomyces erythrochromogenes TaxID=285574 RepID=UPI00332F6C48